MEHENSDSNMLDINGVIDGLYPLNVSHAGREFEALLDGNNQQYATTLLSLTSLIYLQKSA